MFDLSSHNIGVDNDWGRIIFLPERFQKNGKVKNNFLAVIDDQKQKSTFDLFISLTDSNSRVCGASDPEGKIAGLIWSRVKLQLILHSFIASSFLHLH